jgi:hypothetical protein
MTRYVWISLQCFAFNFLTAIDTRLDGENNAPYEQTCLS